MKKIFSAIIVLAVLAGISHAGVDKSGVSPNVISLPSGPGSIEGLGESFEPQLNSGTTTYAVKLKALPGRAGFTPDLTLRYNGGSGNGPFGLGWSLSMPYIQRQTDKGLPEYNDSDTFIESGGEELIPIAGGVYRHENEGAFMRYTISGKGWTAKSKSGGTFKYGISSESRIQSGEKIFRWLLEEMSDTNGNTIRYQYEQLDEGTRRYCIKITYNNHEITFEYESRPDALPDYRPTFRLDTAFRCKSVSMKTNDKFVRRYDLSYLENTYLSLLRSVTQAGDDGTSKLPPAEFTYTTFDPTKASVIAMKGEKEGSFPPYTILINEPDATLNDMNADGLPDLLIAKPRNHQVYLNMGIGSDGTHRWGKWTEMGDADSPDSNLASQGVSLADINGDGRTDYIARQSVDTYFLWRNLGTGKWGPTETFADKSSLTFSFEDPNVRLIDINNDKHTDVMYCNDTSGETYSYFINNGGAEFSKVLTKSGLADAMTFKQRPGMKLADMNGDRLQDIVLLKDGICWYWPSMGMGQWDTEQKMGNPPDSESDNEPGLSNDWQNLMLTDLNGDGLTDVIYAPLHASRIVYWLNRDSIQFDGPFEVKNTPVRNSNTKVQPADMNGNSTTDILWNYPEDADIHADKTWQYLELCPDEKPYLLKTVTNGIGRTITFSYTSTTQEYIRDRESDPWPAGVPNSTTVLSSFDVEDGRGNRYRTELHYHDGYYDGEEKEFRGFAAAEKQEIGDTTIPDLIMAYRFDTGTDHDALKGKPLLLEVQTKQGKIFYREQYTWNTRKLHDSAGGDGRSVTFPLQETKIRNILEKGTGTPVQLKWEYEFDDYGNMTKQIDHGRMDEGWDDERITETSFSSAYESGKSNWIMDRMVETISTDENGTLAAKKRNYYDGNLILGTVSKGNLTRTEDWVEGDKYVVSVRNDYDEYGNVVATYDPLYPDLPGHYRTLVYDDLFHTFPVAEKIHTGELTLSMSATYDYGLGVMRNSTDFNGHITTYNYDTFGRLTSITKPPDTGHTVEYDYVLAHNLGSGKHTNWVETRQKDGSSDGFLRSRTFHDGLGRKIMTRSEGETSGQVVVTDTLQFNARKQPWKKYLPYFETGTLDFAEPTFNTGFTEHLYDALGRDIRVNQPADSDGAVVYSTTVYEPLVRTIQDEEHTNPVSSHYGCGMRYVEDGLQDKDGKGRLREVYEIVRLSDTGESLSDPTEWLTRYQYDLRDNLTRITDSRNNQKMMAYDGLGRKTFMNDPDRGKMHYVYDDAGNLTRTTDAKNQVIRYEYDGVNRLIGEYYGEGKTEPDVAYHYDFPFGPVDQGELWESEPSEDEIIAIILNDGEFNADYDLNQDGMIDVADVVMAAKSGERPARTSKPRRSSVRSSSVTAENTKGFLSYVQDQSGEEHNSYDERGRVSWVIKRIGEQNFHTGMAYDSMDRVTTLTYPDQGSISYTYNARGLLESVPDVIEQYDYNPAGQNAVLNLACGTETAYHYDHRLRLRHLNTVRSSDNLSLQDLAYAFDDVSNIIGIDDARGHADLDTIGGELGISSDGARKFNATQSFVYDSLYRLTQAANSAVYGTINYRYDRIGNMIHKSANLLQADPLMDLGGMTCGGSLGTKNRVGRNAGDVPGPHAITGTEKGLEGAMAFSYDDNGNMTTDRGMTLAWDYRDRLTGITKDAMKADYLYDYSDTRKKKSVSDGDGPTSEVVYVDKFSEIRDGKLVKYVYAGNSRAARIEDGKIYFYLHDHLGSTGFTLSDEGDVLEQLVNYPYGNPRLENTVGSALADYKFTGKERDLESGLQYFEARYYSGTLGRFNRVEPLADSLKKEWLKDPQMLNLYAYALMNPVKLVDPDGKTVYRFGNGTSKQVYINGISSPLKNAINQGKGQVGNDFTLVHNSTSGFFGDILESAYQKARGIPIIGRFLPATNVEKELANVLKGLEPGSVVTGHSQGGLILIRAIESLNRSGVKLDGINFVLNGAAVSKRKACNAIRQSGGTLDAYNVGSLDPVPHWFGTTSIDKVMHPIDTIRSLFGFSNVEKYHVGAYNKR